MVLFVCLRLLAVLFCSLYVCLGSCVFLFCCTFGFCCFYGLLACFCDLGLVVVTLGLLLSCCFYVGLLFGVLLILSVLIWFYFVYWCSLWFGFCYLLFWLCLVLVLCFALDDFFVLLIMYGCCLVLDCVCFVVSCVVISCVYFCFLLWFLVLASTSA